MTALSGAGDDGHGYETDRVLGVGAAARVWRAWDPTHHRWVALKRFHADLSEEESGERFRLECQIAGRLGAHPHVVTTYDSGVADGQGWIAMELCEGGSLASLEEDDPPSLEVALDTFCVLADTLSWVHRQQPLVLHGDIKPGNLLRRADGTVVVGDFGLSVVTDPEVSMTIGGYSLGFAAPEVLATGRYSVRSEVYALLCTFMAMVERGSLMRPGPGETPVAFLERLRSRPLAEHKAIDNLPEPLRPLVRCGLAADAHERWPSMDELADQIRRSQATLGYASTPVLEVPDLPSRGLGEVDSTGRLEPTLLRGVATVLRDAPKDKPSADPNQTLPPHSDPMEEGRDSGSPRRKGLAIGVAASVTVAGVATALLLSAGGSAPRNLGTRTSLTQVLASVSATPSVMPSASSVAASSKVKKKAVPAAQTSAAPVIQTHGARPQSSTPASRSPEPSKAVSTSASSPAKPMKSKTPRSESSQAVTPSPSTVAIVPSPSSAAPPPQAQAPGAPALSGSATSADVRWAWSAPADGGSSIVNYTVEFDGSARSVGLAMSFSTTQCGTHTIRVRASNAAVGTGPWSASVSETRSC